MADSAFNAMEDGGVLSRSLSDGLDLPWETAQAAAAADHGLPSLDMEENRT